MDSVSFHMLFNQLLIDHHYYVRIQAIQTLVLPELSHLQQLASDVSESKKLCQILLDHQAEFEECISSRLNTVLRYLENLIVMTPPPFNLLATTATPKPAVQPEKPENHGFTSPEVHGPFKPTPPRTTINSSPVPSIAIQDTSSGCKHALDPSKLSHMRANSCSRENFSSKLVKELFTVEERGTSNVKGITGKKKLDELRIGYVQAVTFENYLCPSSEQKAAWSKCVKAIDTANRALS